MEGFFYGVKNIKIYQIIMKIGGHVSASVSLDLAFDRAEKIGAQCFQIFISPPQMWAQVKHDQEEIENFRAKLEKLMIGPNFIHGAYLINLATTSQVNLEKAIDWLVYSLETADSLGMAGTIFHLGSHKGVGFDIYENQITQSLITILERSPKSTKLFLENSAGAGGCIGAHFSELGKLIKNVSSSRLKVCLDTQHAFVMGYDVKTLIGLKDMINEFDEEIGMENLEVIHLNDSKMEYRSNRDRHENIGEGFIGLEGIGNIINSKEFKNLPMILEVPGFSNTGPDKENIDLVRSLIK